MDGLRAELAVERQRSRELLEVASALVDLLRGSIESTDEIDRSADGYSAALTQLLSPDGPPRDS